jgi:hypothetical protein
MAYIPQEATKRTRTLPDGIPKPKPSEIRKFKEYCTDPDDVVEFASRVRMQNVKYRCIDDDYELCVVYLKEKHIESIMETFAVAIPTITLIGTPVVTQHPNLSVYMSGLLKNSPKISEWIAYIYEPDLSVVGNTATDEEKIANSIIPIPRDEITIREMRTVLDDCKVPAALTTGAIEIFKGNFGVKPILSGINLIVGYFMPGTKPDTSGVAGQLDMFQ